MAPGGSLISCRPWPMPGRPLTRSWWPCGQSSKETQPMHNGVRTTQPGSGKSGSATDSHATVTRQSKDNPPIPPLRFPLHPLLIPPEKPPLVPP
jgi:hypothetical protein